MKKLLLILLLVCWFTPMQNSKSEVTNKKTSDEKMKKENFYYTCPMHPEVHSDHPGNCPICHMTLIKKNIDAYQNSKMNLTEVSQVEGRKSITLDQSTFSVSGAKLYKIENKNINFTVEAYGKILPNSRFSLQIAEIDLPYITTGMTVKLKAVSMNLSDYQGKITSIDSYLEPMGKTVRAEGIIIGKIMLRPESTLIGAIEIQKNNLLSIPEDAILHNSTSDYVFVYDEKNSSLHPKKISTGLSSNGEVEIQNGLKAGMIITRGANFLLDSESRMQFSYDQKNN
jgi:multidrug efflux pump subunit AcrA (membrane-fusion protein)